MSSARAKLKFRAWESEALNSTLEKVLWNIEGIRQACLEKNVTPDGLGHVAVDGEYLFEVLAAFEIMANTLMEYDLLVCGYQKSTYKVH